MNGFLFFFNWNGETYVKVINNVNSLDHVDKVNLKIYQSFKRIKRKIQF